MVAETAKSVTTSLYQKHINIIHKHKTDNKYNSDAAALQSIIEKFSKGIRNKNLKNGVILVVFPIILCTVINFTAISIQGVRDKLIMKGITDIGYLINLEVIFTSLGWITLGILGMCMIIFFYILQYKD